MKFCSQGTNVWLILWILNQFKGYSTTEASLTKLDEHQHIILILYEILFREGSTGHVERSNSAVKTAFDIQVDGKRGPGSEAQNDLVAADREGLHSREWKLSAIDPHNRDTWRSGVRSAMHAASQLPGRGGPLLWILRCGYCPCMLINKRAKRP